MESKALFRPTEYEALQTIATLTGINRSTWDALGEILLIEFATSGGAPFPVGLSAATLESLLKDLQAAIDCRPDNGGNA